MYKLMTQLPLETPLTPSHASLRLSLWILSQLPGFPHRCTSASKSSPSTRRHSPLKQSLWLSTCPSRHYSQSPTLRYSVLRTTSPSLPLPKRKRSWTRCRRTNERLRMPLKLPSWRASGRFRMRIDRKRRDRRLQWNRMTLHPRTTPKLPLGDRRPRERHPPRQWRSLRTIVASSSPYQCQHLTRGERKTEHWDVECFCWWIRSRSVLY